MDVRKFGYIASYNCQNEEQQLKYMLELGINLHDIFIDHQKGKDFSRFQYQLLKQKLKKGDLVYLPSLYCFGRNKNEILQEWTDFTNYIQADIVVLDIPLLDTTLFKEILDTYVADLVLQILSWTAKEERERIRKKQRKGIECTLQNGSTFGRPKIQLTEEFELVYRKWKAGEIRAVMAMQEIGVKKTTFYKLVKEYENSLNINSI